MDKTGLKILFGENHLEFIEKIRHEWVILYYLEKNHTQDPKKDDFFRRLAELELSVTYLIKYTINTIEIMNETIKNINEKLPPTV